MALPLEGDPKEEEIVANAYLAGFVGRIGMTPDQSEAYVIWFEQTLPGCDVAREIDEEGDDYGRLMSVAVKLGFALESLTEYSFRRHEPRMVMNSGQAANSNTNSYS